MSIAKRLREFRIIKRLTLTEFAKKLNISVRTLGSYERDKMLPGSKFYDLMIQVYNVNANWLITGVGTMFINENVKKNEDSILQLQEEIRFSNEDMSTLISILKSEASRDLVMKLIEIKRGNKKALDSLIANLEGIKAIF